MPSQKTCRTCDSSSQEKSTKDKKLVGLIYPLHNTSKGEGGYLDLLCHFLILLRSYSTGNYERGVSQKWQIWCYIRVNDPLNLPKIGNFCVHTETVEFERQADKQILCFKNSFPDISRFISPAMCEKQKFQSLSIICGQHSLKHKIFCG